MKSSKACWWVTGNYTVTANYLTNRHGRLDLAPGNEPFRIPSDQTADKTQWPELAAKIERERIALDDGASIDYTSFGSKNKRWPNYNNPVPYLDVNNPLRVGTVIKLPQPMILDYRANSVGRKSTKTGGTSSQPSRCRTTTIRQTPNGHAGSRLPPPVKMRQRLLKATSPSPRSMCSTISPPWVKTSISVPHTPHTTEPS